MAASWSFFTSLFSESMYSIAWSSCKVFIVRAEISTAKSELQLKPKAQMRKNNGAGVLSKIAVPDP